MRDKLAVVDGNSTPFLRLIPIYEMVIALPDRNARMLLLATLLVRSELAVVPLEHKGYVFKKSGRKASGKELHHSFGNSYNQAIVSEDTVLKHWSQGGKYEGCGVGLACGPPLSDVKCHRLFVIDIDTGKDGGPDGMATLHERESDFGPLPLDAPINATPSGGRHILFQWAEGLKNTESSIGPGIDSRGGSQDHEGKWGRGGHIVFDPDLGYKPLNDGYLKPLPTQWRLAFISVSGKPLHLKGESRGQNVGLSDLDIQSYVNSIDAIPEGRRNSVLYKLGLSALSKSFGDLEYAARIVREAALKCEGGMDDAEIEYIIGRIDKSRVAQSARERGEINGKWQVTERGKPRQSNEYNANLVVESGVFANKWDIAFDEFYWATTVNGAAITDTLETEIRLWMTKTFRIDFNKGHVRDALSRVAVKRRTHAFRKWLEDLPAWDRQDRFMDLQGLLLEPDSAVPEDEQALNASVLRKTLISAVARAYDIWEKVRHMTILVGPQDSGKSDLWKFLCPELNGDRAFTDSVTFKSLNKGADGHRDMLKQMAGCVFAEFAEMAGLTKQREEEVKLFISSNKGKFVNKYEKHADKEPIHSIPVGTANPSSLLKDSTGLSRWHPLACTAETIDTSWISANLEQIWAQALHQYRVGEKHWFEKSESEYHRLQTRAMDFRAVWGPAKELAEIIAQGAPPFDHWFVPKAMVKQAAQKLLENGVIEDYPKLDEQAFAMSRAGWVATEDPSYNKCWKFKLTAGDIDEFGELILGKSRKPGGLVSVDKGWVSPKVAMRFGSLTNAEKARLFVRLADEHGLPAPPRREEILAGEEF